MTVHNGVAAPVRPGSGRAVRAELGIPADAPLISMITVLREGKGHGVAIEAMREVRRTSPHARLLILGDGPERDDIRAASAHLRESVILAGHRDDVLDVLDATDVLLHPTRIDAFPTALLEAMAARVPIVASRVGGIPEIVEHRRQGLLIDAPPSAGAAAEALVELLGDSGLRRSLGVAGRRRFEERFTAEAWMRRLLPVYEAALAAGPRRRRPRAAGGLPSTEEAAP